MNLTLTIEEANLVLAGLLELPAKMSMQLIQKIHQQAQEQQADIEESEEVEVEVVEEAPQTHKKRGQSPLFYNGSSSASDSSIQGGDSVRVAGVICSFKFSSAAFSIESLLFKAYIHSKTFSDFKSLY